MVCKKGVKMKRLLLIILVVSVGLCAFGVTRYLCAESVCGVATSGERELMLKVSNFSRLSTALHLYLESNNYFARLLFRCFCWAHSGRFFCGRTGKAV
jgi:hypothetical protein